jgi:hypothetical protein
MMNSRAKAMEKLKSHPSPATRSAIALLEPESVRPVSERAASLTAHEALRLWRTRLRNTKLTQKRIHGLPEMVRKLEDLTPQKKVEQFAFTSQGSAITLLFEKTSGVFIGAARVISPSPKD